MVFRVTTSLQMNLAWTIGTAMKTIIFGIYLGVSKTKLSP